MNIFGEAIYFYGSLLSISLQSAVSNLCVLLISVSVNFFTLTKMNPLGNLGPAHDIDGIRSFPSLYLKGKNIKT